LTIRGKSSTGEVQGLAGFCQPPQQALRWTQGLTLPAECFTVRLDVHQRPAGDTWCYSFEVYDPHTRERLATVVEPARTFSEVLPLASIVTVDLRGILLALTDPDPF
jgi:hypothetical protein